MSQRRSKPVAIVTARARQGAPGRQVGDKRGPAARNRVRPIVPATLERPADAQAAASPSYLQWAGFMGAPSGDAGFGAYFPGEAPIGAYTWTPARRG